MLSKILAQHLPVRFCLLRDPALFEVFPAIFGLLATVNYCITQKLPVCENVQFLHLKNADPGVVGGELVVACFRRKMPLRLIVRA